MRECQESVSCPPKIPVLACDRVAATVPNADILKENFTMTIKVLGLCGSARRDSLNRKLLEIALFGARAAGADVTQIRLTDLKLPIYDGDAEAEYGLPDGAHALKCSIAEHQALMIATPEHNGGYSALLKNAIDWISRPSDGDPTGLQITAGKLAALISASPGALGGLRSQIALQLSLSKLGVLVIPNSFALSGAHQAFDEQGCLKDTNAEKMVHEVGAALAKLATKLNSTDLTS
jgi:NAD(P)H-dependent FMN reductase